MSVGGCHVSVVMPTRNTPLALLERALASVAGQSATCGVEVVLCDDGSSDDGRRAADEAAARRPSGLSVTLLRHAVGRGISAARNTAVRATRGQWVVWLDADDQLAPDAVATMLAEADRVGARLVVPQCMILEPAGSRVHRNRPYLERARFEAGTADDPLAQVVFPVHGSLVARSLAGEVSFDERFEYAELTDWFLRAVEVDGPAEIGVVDEPLYQYSRTAESHSARRERLDLGRQRALLAYARRRQIDIDDLVYSGRSVVTGAQHYTPWQDGRPVATSYAAWQLRHDF